MTIIVQRSGALGDVILTTPIIRRLRREYSTEHISVVTAYPDVFKNSPHVGGAIGFSDVRHVDLDLAYEKQPDMHIVQAYMFEAFGDLGKPEDLQQELFYPEANKPRTFGRVSVAVHAAVAGWANRTLPRATWRRVVEGLHKAGFWPVLVGTSRDDIPDCEVTRFFSLDIRAQARFLDMTSCFVGSDSAVLHIAGATTVPIVGVFTCARPETRLPYRNGILGYNCTAVVPELNCIGCLHRRPSPVTTELCERGDTLCVSMIRPEAIIEAVIASVSRNAQ